ncbi:hypothetical protein D3C72_1157770 [compost metagenome]
MAIALQAEQTHVLHAVAEAAIADIAASAHIRLRPTPHPTPRRGAAESFGAAAGDPAAANRVGREQVLPWCTRLLK